MIQLFDAFFDILPEGGVDEGAERSESRLRRPEPARVVKGGYEAP